MSVIVDFAFLLVVTIFVILIGFVLFEEMARNKKEKKEMEKWTRLDRRRNSAKKIKIL